MAVSFRTVLAVAVCLVVTVCCSPTIRKEELNHVRGGGEKPIEPIIEPFDKIMPIVEPIVIEPPTPEPPTPEPFNSILKIIIEKEEHFENVDPNLYEGDIKLTDEQKAAVHTKQGIASTSYLWPNANIPYRFINATLIKSDTMLAINYWREHTCLTFNEVPETFSGHHIQFISRGGCWSYVGRIESFEDGQELSLSAGCAKEVGPAIHEIMHAAGTFHEQSRSDRDTYVKILFENIQTGKEGNFQQATTNDYNTPYDYYSVMHYNKKDFSKNGKNTVEAVRTNTLYNLLIGNRKEMSFYDKKMMNTMYKCIENWQTEFSRPADYCSNDGFVGKTGDCVCPDGTSGDKCQTKDKDYHSALIEKLWPESENITEAKNINTPGYPTPYSDGLNFVKVIKAPKCHKVKLTINGFEVYPHCGVDRLGITVDPYGADESDEFCGTSLTAGRVFESVDDTMVLAYKSYNYTSLGYISWLPGFSATIAHVPVAGCN